MSLNDNGTIRDPYQNFIALSRYARWDENKGRREVWSETVDRLVEFFGEDLTERVGYDVSKKVLAEVKEAVLSQNVMPSMRALMTAGPALKRNQIAAYNCSFLPVDTLRAFDETLLILMQGTGLGFSVESKYVSKLPEVAESFHKSDTTIKVGDSKEGWAKAYKELIAMVWSGNIPEWDMSLVRPAGARLKTFGGRASGPEPLDQLFQHTITTVKGAAGRRLKPIEAHSIMCKIAEVVVVGGVRRSALISLSDLDDYEMARAKSGAWWETQGHFGLANNSAVYDKKPSVEHFLDEWKSLIESKSGERGIFNLYAARNLTERAGRRDAEQITGTNPCCVIATTSIMTTEGPREIQDLEGTPFTAIVDGKEYDAPHGSWISGITTELVVLKTREGYELELTPEHKILMDDGRTWKQAKDLVSGDKISLNQHKDVEWGSSDNYGDGYLLGLFVGDGNWANKETSTSRRMAQVKVWNDDDAESLITPARGYAESVKKRSDWKGFVDKGDYQVMTIGALPYEYGISSANKHDISALEENSSEFYKGFLRGIFDADGHVEGWDESKPNKGFSIRLGQSDYDLLLTVQRMLIRLGIKSTIAPLAPERMQSLPNGKGGMSEYKCQESWRLIISADHALEYVRRIGFNHKAKAAKCENVISWRKKVYKKPFVATVDCVDKVEGEYEVWDAEVSDVHAFDANGIYAHNSEINLRNNEFCNLTEVVVRAEDTLDDLKKKVELATILGTWQSTLTDIKYLRKVWKNNIEEERLLGVSLTGQFGHKVLNGSEGMDKLAEWLEILRDHAIEVNKKEANRIGIPQSAAITCVKPSGCRPGEAITVTDSGIFTLDELLVNHAIDSEWNDIYGLKATNGDAITKTYRNGISDVAKIVLSNNFELESTYNHKWYVSGYHNGNAFVKGFEPGWFETSELLPGHVIESNIGSYVNSIDAEMTNEFVPAYNAREVKIPNQMTPDLAWLLGYLWGDGSMTGLDKKGRLRFIDENRFNLEKVQRILKDVFEKDSIISRASQGRNAWVIEVASTTIMGFLLENGIWKYSENGLADIPMIIRRSSKESILAFIAGLIDSDGGIYAKSNGKAAMVSTCYEGFAKHLQNVAASCGIVFGRSHNTQGENKQAIRSMWLMWVANETDCDSMNILASHSNKAARFLTDKDWNCNNRAKIIFGKVQSVEYSRTVETYDIEVEDSHWYQAGAFKSHNTVSQLCGVSSGMHPWHSEYYIRTIRGDNKDPITQFMKDQGIPNEPDVMNPLNTTVFSFPVKAPEGAVTREDINAMDHLELWLAYQRHWCEHKPSVTISVRDDEWFDVGAWVYRHFDEVSGVSFLPHSDHTYQQAPYQDITKKEYEDASAKMPKDIDWTDLEFYELEDATTGSQELACSAGGCDVADIVSTETVDA